MPPVTRALELDAISLTAATVSLTAAIFQTVGKETCFANYMFSLYDKVVAVGLPNFMWAQIPVPTNLNLEAW